MASFSTRNIHRDMKKVRLFSSIVEKKIAQFHNKEERKIEKLSFEQLEDLNQLTRAADYILSKYEGNKEVYSLLKEFVEMINNSSASIDLLNDKICELVVSANSAISRIKNLQGDVSENFSLISPNKANQAEVQDIVPESSTNNLTKSTTAVYT